MNFVYSQHVDLSFRCETQRWHSLSRVFFLWHVYRPNAFCKICSCFLFSFSLSCFSIVTHNGKRVVPISDVMFVYWWLKWLNLFRWSQYERKWGQPLLLNLLQTRNRVVKIEHIFCELESSLNWTKSYLWPFRWKLCMYVLGAPNDSFL